MNERIKQLLSQAHTDSTDIKDTNWIANRFAELIVAECAQACINMGNDYEIKSAGQYQAELFAFAIKKHFGVEE
jgi:hypothetical protein